MKDSQSLFSLYVEFIDKIDETKFSKTEVKAKKIAKFGSLIPGWLGYGLILCILIPLKTFLGVIPGAQDGLGAVSWVLRLMAKWNRVIWYYIIYYPAYGICKLMDSQG
jgi:hypothetical protein